MQILHAVTLEHAWAGGSMHPLHQSAVRMQRLRRRDGVGVVAGQDMRILHAARVGVQLHPADLASSGRNGRFERFGAWRVRCLSRK
jgi:hypothetical protein